MIRLLISLAVLAAVAYGLAWLADRPGDIMLVWQGYEVRTSLMAFAIAVLGVVVALILLWNIIRVILHSPQGVTTFFRTRRRSKGFNAVTQGMIAVGSGDVRRAQKTAADAARILGDEPLALLLRAQAAQLAGDRTAAESTFRAMLENAETKPLALRGLFVEARRRGDDVAARAFAAEAVRSAPQLPWAGSALLEFQSLSKDWDAALQTLARNAENKIIDKETARRHRAVLLTARALAEAERDRARAKASILEAVKLAPGLVPAAVLGAKLYSEAGDYRRASRILEAAWKLNPHPDLAEAYKNVRLGDSARDRFDRIRTLAAIKPGHAESDVALAKAAIGAREYKIARQALAAQVTEGPTERVCLLMAEIEESENGATGKVREWLSRAIRAPRDAVWVADGMVSDTWLPVSPTTGRLDAFEWRTPVERLGGPVVVPADHVLADVDEPVQIPAPTAPVVEPAPVPIVVVAPPPAPPAPVIVEPAKPATVIEAEPILGTHPTPDDPGPDPESAAPKRRTSLFG
jgi:HemY protein